MYNLHIHVLCMTVKLEKKDVKISLKAVSGVTDGGMHIHFSLYAAVRP